MMNGRLLNKAQAGQPVDYANLPIGYVFETRYEIVKTLERGSGGSVYLVRDLTVMRQRQYLARTSHILNPESAYSTLIDLSEQVVLQPLLPLQQRDDRWEFQTGNSDILTKREELFVLKLFQGSNQFTFFEREYNTLNKIKQTQDRDRESFPGIVKLIKAEKVPHARTAYAVGSQ